MKNQAQSLICDVLTGKEMDVNNQANVPLETKTSQEKIAQIRYNTKKEVQKIMKKPKFFKCRDYIMESTKRSVNRIVADKNQIIPKLAGYEKNESYTAYVKRMSGAV